MNAMQQEYSKLVWYKIPEIIQKSYRAVTPSHAEYLKALGAKLIEEAEETAILRSP